jgi:hypothetical protein
VSLGEGDGRALEPMATGTKAALAGPADGASPAAVKPDAGSGVLIAVGPVVVLDHAAIHANPATPAPGFKLRPPVIAFDIDGTLLRHHPRQPVYTSPESVLENCRPIWDACERVRGFIEAGHEVHYITGRSGLVLTATLRQLQAWVHQSVTSTRIHCNAAWAGYEAMTAHKAARLRHLGAVLYVGDHAADEAAALDAGVPFLHADRFAAGDPLPLPSTLLSA